MNKNILAYRSAFTDEEWEAHLANLPPGKRARIEEALGQTIGNILAAGVGISDADWWQQKHKEDCGSLAEQLHRRTEQLFAASNKLTEIQNYLPTLEENSRRLPLIEEESARTRKECNVLAELLAEWLDTPFFKDEAEWRAWRDGFAKRVEEALEALP